MDEPCSIQASYPSYIKKNETTEIVSQKSNFLGSPHYAASLLSQTAATSFREAGGVKPGCAKKEETFCV